MKQFNENDFRRETETGYLLSMLMLKLLVWCMIAGFGWMFYWLITNSNSFAFPVREFSTR